MSSTVGNNNKFKVSFLVAALIGIGIGSLGYVRYNEADKRKKEFEVLFSSVNASLPQGFEQKHTVESGVFSSQGKYDIIYKNKEDSKYDSAYVTEYKVNHGLVYYFTGLMTLEATSKLEGFAATKVKSAGNLITTTGKIDNNGSSEFSSQGNELTIGTDSQPLVIKPFNIVQSFNAKNGDIKNTFNFPSIEFTTKNKPVVINGLVIKRDGSQSNLEVGLFSLNVASITSDKFKSDGFEMSSNITLENDTYNDKGGLHIRKVVTNDKHVFSKLDLKYTIKGIDKTSADYFMDLYRNSSNREQLKEQEIKVAKENMKRLIQKGLIFNIENFNIDASFGTLDLNSKLTLKPVNSPAAVSIKDQLLFNLTAKAQGELVPMAKSRYTTQMEGMPIPADSSNDPKKWDLNVTYENNQIKVNGEVLPEQATTMINQMSENFNQALK